MRKFSRDHAKQGSLLAGLLVAFGLGGRSVGDDVVRMGARAFNPADDVVQTGGRAVGTKLRAGRPLGAGKHRELAKGVELVDRGSAVVNLNGPQAPRLGESNARFESGSMLRPASEPLRPYRPKPLLIEKLR